MAPSGRGAIATAPDLGGKSAASRRRKVARFGGASRRRKVARFGETGKRDGGVRRRLGGVEVERDRGSPGADPPPPPR
eukprot:6280375-Pyramimonas_sp.AAC.1